MMTKSSLSLDSRVCSAAGLFASVLQSVDCERGSHCPPSTVLYTPSIRYYCLPIVVNWNTTFSVKRFDSLDLLKACIHAHRCKAERADHFGSAKS